MRAMETRLPPPVLLVLLAFAVWMTRHAPPAPTFNLHVVHAAAGLLMLAGLVLNVTPKRGFRRVGTTVNPMRPQASSHLVTGGLYRYSRNPMYLGHVLLLVGWGVWWQAWAGLPAVVLQVLWLTRLQIQPEERALRAHFGAAYASYCANVRRWL
ncbi:MAG: isoprenylcysteine carboxylmethyltransferase family protein [Pseudoxanthomonas sp.]|nr:isoprenylcysteine carboxylmethyltransferase family protein [Pseudoxanthomonas sp.]WDS38190.1 MAG: isoprenylcysteine carboxylmethyltransferase family protein [Pseudoxanthomonas sp.]